MVIELQSRVIEELERQDRTVSWLARRAELSPSYVGRMLKGERPLTDEFKKAAAGILGVPVEQLFGAPAEVPS